MRREEGIFPKDCYVSVGVKTEAVAVVDAGYFDPVKTKSRLNVDRFELRKVSVTVQHQLQDYSGITEV